MTARPGNGRAVMPTPVAWGNLRLLRLRRGRSGSGMAALPVTLAPGKPSRPPPAPAGLGAECQGRLDAAGAGLLPRWAGRVTGWLGLVSGHGQSGSVPGALMSA